MQLGGLFIWTHTYQLIRGSATKYYGTRNAKDVIKVPNKDLDDNKETHLLKGEDEEHDTSNSSPSQSSVEDVEKQAVSPPCFELLTRYDMYPIPIGEPNPKD